MLCIETHLKKYGIEIDDFIRLVENSKTTFDEYCRKLSPHSTLFGSGFIWDGPRAREVSLNWYEISENWNGLISEHEWNRIPLQELLDRGDVIVYEADKKSKYYTEKPLFSEIKEII